MSWTSARCGAIWPTSSRVSGKGSRGKRAVRWKLVDEAVPLSRFAERVPERARALAEQAGERSGPGVELTPLAGEYSDMGVEYRYVTLELDNSQRVGTLTMRGPDVDPPTGAVELRGLGAAAWALRAFRELNDALLDLRFNRPEIGVIVVRTQGDIGRVLAWDAALAEQAKSDWFASEILHFMRRVLKRMDVTARSFIASIDEGSCFAGSLFELALAADRSYMLDVDDGPEVAISQLNQAGVLPMANGLSRLETRFLGDPQAAVIEPGERFDSQAALDAGLVTYAPDDIDWEDEVRLAIEGAGQHLPRRLDGHGGEPPLRRPGNHGDQDLRPPVGLAELDLPTTERRR